MDVVLPKSPAGAGDMDLLVVIYISSELHVISFQKKPLLQTVVQVKQIADYCRNIISLIDLDSGIWNLEGGIVSR